MFHHIASTALKPGPQGFKNRPSKPTLPPYIGAAGAAAAAVPWWPVFFDEADLGTQGFQDGRAVDFRGYPTSRVTSRHEPTRKKGTLRHDDGNEKGLQGTLQASWCGYTA